MINLTITNEFARELATLLINDYNNHQGKKEGNLRFIAFRCLYNHLKELQQAPMIMHAQKPIDFEPKCWFEGKPIKIKNNQI